MYITMSRTVVQPSGFSRGNGRPLDDLVRDQSEAALLGHTNLELEGTGSGSGSLTVDSPDSVHRQSR